MNKPVIHLTGGRKPHADTRVLLFTFAGGRCEFDGCNRYLLSHHVTHADGNFAEMAHIVAFSPAGPRGKVGLSTQERNQLSNLMLLCAACHKLIDDRPAQYTVETLKAFKREHEARIRMLTEAKADQVTTPVVLEASIGKAPVVISTANIQSAVAPFYFDERHVERIDLAAIPETRTDAYWQSGVETIERRVADLYRGMRNTDRTHVSVFALAPIPLLVALGSSLSNKYPTQLFQRHRDTGDWAWKDEGPAVAFRFQVRHGVPTAEHVALVLSVSGMVPDIDYERVLGPDFVVYEILPDGVPPSFDLLRTRETLESFRAEYRAGLQRIRRDHPSAGEIHLLPAVPAPIAVALGFDWMDKAHPSLVVYDKAGGGGFSRAVAIHPE